ncbi:hypothetical protein EKD16_25720 (plasmid) [Streptomonospora litoralis]|uniref:Uncharacterized protein n=1 Tax=Streptomonospora litoralis TaxID=2498135 RepID=A0A4P6QBB7_9ACTN|nr:hypothetical protein EKD16_25720 [Streptomonospora litoralis]
MLYHLHANVQIPRTRNDLLISVDTLVRPHERPIDLQVTDDLTLLRVHLGTQTWWIIDRVTDEVPEHRWRHWATEAGCPAHLHPLQFWDPHTRVMPEHIPPRMRLTGHDHAYRPPRALSA